MSGEVRCPWCGQKVNPEVRVLRRKISEVLERSCPRCGKVIAAYPNGDRFLNFIRERVTTFKD